MSNWEFIKNNYIDKKLKIFPVEPNGKKPLIENWQNDCSYDFYQVLYWYQNAPGCNWGLPCTPNNLFVLDLDVHDENKNGVDNFDKILTDKVYNAGFDIKAADVIDTLMQHTPSGGCHIIFKTDDDLKNVSNGSNVFKDYPGIDIRTDGYIVVEPSVINDKGYTFVANKDVSQMDEKLKSFVIENANLKSEKQKEPYKKPTSVECGDRDNQLFLYINNLYQKTNLDYDEILVLALNFNDNVLEKPFSEKTVKYKVDKTFDKDRNKYIFIKLSNE